MRKRILLIDPPFQKFMNFSKAGIPLGLLYLAGSLKKKGHAVKVLDADYNPHGIPYPFVKKAEHYEDYLKNLNNQEHPIWRGIQSHIKKEKLEVVGISIVSPKLESGLRIAKIAKNLGVKKVIIGGAHVTIRPNDIFKNNCVDSIVIGEGENVFERALKEKGIIIGERIKNLDSLEWPARDSLIGVENYEKKDLGYIITSRGCPNNCNFCGSNALWGNLVRMRDIKNVVKEMDHVYQKYNVNEFYLVDDTFTMNPKRVIQFCGLVKNKDYKWNCLTRVDKIDKRTLEKMIESGCSMIKVGIESGSQRVLDLMNKRTTIEQIKKAAELFNKYKMHWLAYVMIGVPGETIEDADMTLDLINKIKPSYVGASIYAPYPGTGFSKNDGNLNLSWAQVGHDNINRPTGNIPKKKVIDFMKSIDKYNHSSKEAHEIYKC